MEIFTPQEIKEKKPPGRQPHHSQEFMMMVARKVVDEGMTYREAAKMIQNTYRSSARHLMVLRCVHSNSSQIRVNTRY